ncbi:oxidoreductase NAD-binding domain-containing protein 1 isoform X1 [Lagopus leucura]|uniref:oxidoreductase NAD-binding domain-containing protein 1 isoform X1 n=1 Tax=Lagopus leucura TaxID=30410 RepID=UPI001C678569|nr:oxidoreductase NAD-binding domain-containing protein 1 isoform X1 [Lagopus leucura]XP_042744227.1 oxidoreductase NAD-binding domain-containing protein 1 isoform X1 [Lagopus leucura]XP_042744228.1 oxidoreductase NAD-binding domain-containing protein 1 isoform X1 [Lagopus leucura]XP_042744229.1 oxidoreductase NAD-binding domain-containing protein 1 isoform X1 [Lagopus leucura]
MAHVTTYMGFTIPHLLRSACRLCPAHSALVVLRHSASCYCTVKGTAQSKRKMDHLERTANNFRQEVISQAKVCGITSESETVKRLRLAITNKDFTFKAGQWVDFFIPGVPVIGGFSMCSSPGLLEREGVLELAVKYTDHPPARWIHTECTLDSEVALRVGGDFFFDPQPGDTPVKLVLIAGGVGINPLFSILLHVADLHGYQESKGNGYKMGTVKLYYSAKNTNELLFKKNILGLMSALPGKISCRFHVTQQNSPICEELQPHVTEGRISEKDLEKHVSKDTLWYICGPPPMIESISQLLYNSGVHRNCVFFEKWW